ncbi:hypothetical protein QTH97_27155 [Variovorax sp. J22R24]|uniref:hypothetical protein n=1 Tax=Variovorax gracilis TaxID=3053502 RepID=UPI0025773616|nr:hypothetical protein [Variovorax sp. J22R24]MDM0108654.1 hypothetical protein [Variovorax sp. J22R24]
MEISREDLYRRVWETPLTRLAAEWGLTDVGLAKLCRRHNIPTPPVGHWTKVAHGKGVMRPALPEANETTVALSTAPAPPSTGAAVVAEEFPDLKIVVRQDLSNLAPVAAATFVSLLKTKTADSGLVFSGGPKLASCSLSRATVERAVRLLDAIERALPAVNAKFVHAKDAGRLSVEVDGEKVTFSLDEKFKRTEHVTQDPRYPSLKNRDYTYEFSGDLKVSIDGYYDGRKTWSDGSRARLDDKLTEVILGLVAAARSMRARREEREAQRLRWEEVAKIRAREAEEERRLLAFRSKFANEAAAWVRHREAQEYLAFLQRSLSDGQPEVALPEASTAWLGVAQRAVAELDPSAHRLHLLRTGYSPSSWEAPFGGVIVKESARGSPAA